MDTVLRAHGQPQPNFPLFLSPQKSKSTMYADIPYYDLNSYPNILINMREVYKENAK